MVLPPNLAVTLGEIAASLRSTLRAKKYRSYWTKSVVWLLVDLSSLFEPLALVRNGDGCDGVIRRYNSSERGSAIGCF